jgi:hypothetical protein
MAESGSKAEDVITFRRTCPRSNWFIFNSIFFSVILLFLLVKVVANDPTSGLGWLTIVALLCIEFFVLRIWGLLTVVSISQEGITFSAPMDKQIYLWNDIKIVGMYTLSRTRVDHITPNQFEAKPWFLDRKMVWLCKDITIRPTGMTPPDTVYADFEFTPEAWKKMKFHLSQYTVIHDPLEHLNKTKRKQK